MFARGDPGAFDQPAGLRKRVIKYTIVFFLKIDRQIDTPTQKLFGLQVQEQQDPEPRPRLRLRPLVLFPDQDLEFLVVGRGVDVFVLALQVPVEESGVLASVLDVGD